MIVEHPLIHESGVFFGQPEAEYHAALALSASGIKWLRASSLDWWARSPLNPEPVDDETEAKETGKAYHTRILMGREAFEAAYASQMTRDAWRNEQRILYTKEDLMQVIVEGGYRKPPISTRKAELAEMVRSFSPDALIWDDLEAAHARQHAGKILLTPGLMSRIEVAAAMIERHPDLGRAFRDGAPEVSIFWTDEATGVPCKARLDYLKPRLVVDLKTFTNLYGINLDRAIARAMATYRYHVQAAWYLEAVKAAQHTPTRGSVAHTSDMLRLIDYGDHEFLFVFQQQGIAPVARGKLFGPGMVMDIARQEIEQAKQIWARCWETFGTDPWIDTTEISAFDDSEFPAYIGE